MSDKRKKIIVIIILIISALPWVFALGYSIYYGIVGYSWFFQKVSGFEAFYSYFLLLVFYCWYIYLPTAIVFILCISYLLYQKFFKRK